MLIIIGIGLIAGASFTNGAGGVAVLVLVACLLAGSVAALSNGLALVAKQRETLIGAVTFVTLPVTFLSSTFMQPNLVPGWIRSVARFNPVNWRSKQGAPRLCHTPTGGSSGRGSGSSADCCC